MHFGMFEIKKVKNTEGKNEIIKLSFYLVIHGKFEGKKI